MQRVLKLTAALAVSVVVGVATLPYDALAAELGGAHATTPGGPYEVFGLHSDDMLVMRRAADVLSAPFSWITYDARDVVVLEVSEDGIWGRVQRDGETGWVMMRHLRAF
jgi:hypothetical protein